MNSCSFYIKRKKQRKKKLDTNVSSCLVTGTDERHSLGTCRPLPQDRYHMPPPHHASGFIRAGECPGCFGTITLVTRRGTEGRKCSVTVENITRSLTRRSIPVQRGLTSWWADHFHLLQTQRSRQDETCPHLCLHRSGQHLLHICFYASVKFKKRAVSPLMTPSSLCVCLTHAFTRESLLTSDGEVPHHTVTGFSDKLFGGTGGKRVF